MPPPSIYKKDRGAQYGTLFHDAMAVLSLDKPEKTGNDRLDKDIANCVDALRPLLPKGQVFRETAFLQSIEKDSVPIIIQGVVDMMIVGEKEIILIDYKTNTRSLKGDEITMESLAELYDGQLAMYADAIMKAGKKPVRKYIYSTHLNALREILNY